MLFVASPDIKELRKALAAAGPAWERDIVKAHREVGKVGANIARSAARSSGTRQQKAAAAAIGQSASKKGAKVTVGAPAAAPFGRAAFWGTKKRYGWFAAQKYGGSNAKGGATYKFGNTTKSSGKAQFPEWVGNEWKVGVRGQGPHVINDALADHLDEIRAVYGKQVEEVAKALAARRVTSF